MHLDTGAIGSFAEPHVEVLTLSRLEEENVIAVVEFGNLIEVE